VTLVKNADRHPLTTNTRNTVHSKWRIICFSGTDITPAVREHVHGFLSSYGVGKINCEVPVCF
jgi:hypothetical protein